MSTNASSNTEAPAEGTQSAGQPTEAPKPAAPAPGAPTTTPAATEAPAVAPAAADTPEGQEGEPEGKGKAGAEAAKYRTQLRSAEAERDTLAGSVETLRRQIIAANMPPISTGGPELLWATGHTAADMFTAEGALDPDKLKEAVKDSHAKLGIKLQHLTSPVPSSGTRGPDTGGGTTWSDVLKR